MVIVFWEEKEALLRKVIVSKYCEDGGVSKKKVSRYRKSWCWGGITYLGDESVYSKVFKKGWVLELGQRD